MLRSASRLVGGRVALKRCRAAISAGARSMSDNAHAQVCTQYCIKAVKGLQLYCRVVLSLVRVLTVKRWMVLLWNLKLCAFRINLNLQHHSASRVYPEVQPLKGLYFMRLRTL